MFFFRYYVSALVDDVGASNDELCDISVETSPSMSCVSIICDNLRWDNSRRVQLLCCRILVTFLNLGILEASWPKFTFKVLPSLVRMCKPDSDTSHRIEAAELIYLLTEKHPHLQASAVITERFITILSKYFSLPAKDFDVSI